MVLVAKPAGPTSHDVVDIVRRALGISRVGHLGTLDPFARGLLVLVVGRATRLATFAAGWLKTYAGTIRLGTTTSTDDATGPVIATSEAWRALDRVGIERAFQRFRGPYDQEPPAYSAVHVAGERAYRRARRGEGMTLAPRRVEVRELVLEQAALPDLAFRAVVSAGTYLRGLARDLGVTLGCGAHLAELERRALGPFRVEQALVPQAVTSVDVLDPTPLVAHLARRALDGAERAAIVHGRAVSAAGVAGDGAVALFANDQLVAVAERQGDILKPRVVVAES